MTRLKGCQVDVSFGRNTQRRWPDVNVDPLRTRSEWDEAVKLGWIMESGELTGAGLAQAHDLLGGVVPVTVKEQDWVKNPLPCGFVFPWRVG